VEVCCTGGVEYVGVEAGVVELNGFEPDLSLDVTLVDTSEVEHGVSD
jgi:hypothetical protein